MHWPFESEPPVRQLVQWVAPAPSQVAQLASQAAQVRFWATFPSAQACVWYWLVVHVVQPEQIRSVVAVGATLMYCPVPQFVRGVQTRSSVPLPFAQAWLSYVPAPQGLVHAVQTRSVVGVGAASWYWPVEQSETGLQTRFCGEFPFAQAWLS